MLAVALLLALAGLLLFWTGFLHNGRNEWVQRTHRVAMQELDAGWVETLRHGHITSIRSVHSRAAFAKKARVFFGDDSKSAIVKLIHRVPEDLAAASATSRESAQSSAAYGGGIPPALHLPKEPTCHVGERGVLFQGWAEIPAWHVDRLLEINLKPPTVGRVFDREELMEIDPAARRFFAMEGDETTSVSLQLWIEGVQEKLPSKEQLGLLTGRLPVQRAAPEEIEQALAISDSFVLDFLLDDHDREARKNWVSDALGRLVVLDSGLAWGHGPFGAESCLSDILCDPWPMWEDQGKGVDIFVKHGPVEPTFIEENGFTFKRKVTHECELVCRFRKRTVELLELMGPNAMPSERLGERLRTSVADDALFPVFHLGHWEKLEGKKASCSFTPDDFFWGLDQRVSALLNHIRSCQGQVSQVLL